MDKASCFCFSKAARPRGRGGELRGTVAVGTDVDFDGEPGPA
jgi:hypothetical protein